MTIKTTKQLNTAQGAQAKPSKKLSSASVTVASSNRHSHKPRRVLPKSRPVTIKQIEYFTSVVEQGSLTAAAQKNNITVQGMSQAMDDLEREAGTRLLSRSKAGTAPTAFGEEFYVRAKELLTQYDKFDMFAHSFMRDIVR